MQFCLILFIFILKEKIRKNREEIPLFFPYIIQSFKKCFESRFEKSDRERYFGSIIINFFSIIFFKKIR